MQIITYGAAGQTVADLHKLVTKHRVGLIADLRATPAHRGRDQSWTPDALRISFPGIYRWFTDLATQTPAAEIAAGKAPVCRNIDRGLSELARYINTTEAWILLGDQEDPNRCVRRYIAHGFSAELMIPVTHHRQPKAATKTPGLNL